MEEYIQNNRWQIIGLGSLVLFIYLLSGYILPEFNNTMQIYQDWQRQEEKIASVHNWESQFEQLKNQQEELEALFSRIYVSLPDDDQMSTIVNQIFNAAEAVELKIDQMRPNEREEFQSHLEIPITVTLRGGYHQMGRFVNVIEQSRYLMKVDDIDIQAEREAGTPLTAQALIKVIILKRQTEGNLETDA